MSLNISSQVGFYTLSSFCLYPDLLFSAICGLDIWTDLFQGCRRAQQWRFLPHIGPSCLFYRSLIAEDSKYTRWSHVTVLNNGTVLGIFILCLSLCLCFPFLADVLRQLFILTLLVFSEQFQLILEPISMCLFSWIVASIVYDLALACSEIHMPSHCLEWQFDCLSLNHQMTL